jgi:putative endonuclease
MRKIIFYMNKKQYYIYLLTNQNNTVIYTGVTSNLTKRIWEHKNKLVKGFTQRYNIGKLVYLTIKNHLLRRW